MKVHEENYREYLSANGWHLTDPVLSDKNGQFLSKDINLATVGAQRARKGVSNNTPPTHSQASENLGGRKKILEFSKIF